MAPTRAQIAVRKSLTVDPDHEQRIREHAYRLWEADGKPHGRDIEYWQRARERTGMEESIGGLPLANPVNTRIAGIEEAAIQQNSGELADRLVDQGDVKATQTPKRRARAKPKKPA